MSQHPQHLTVHFRIKTRSGGVVNTVIFDARDFWDAKYKLEKQYPGCTILEAR